MMGYVLRGKWLGCFLLLLLCTPALAEINVHSQVAVDMNGDEIPLSNFKGKALLIVNTASRCGYTNQYQSMQKLYETYRERGFEVLAFPANNFGGQEPGTNAEIKEFCLLKYRTTFPIFAKSSVKGTDISELYKYLTTESEFAGPITWNFNKFLVDPQGNVVKRYGSAIDPLTQDFVNDLVQILPN